jgi:hypothetical protein
MLNENRKMKSEKEKGKQARRKKKIVEMASRRRAMTELGMSHCP